MKIEIFCEGDIALPYKNITKTKLKKSLENIGSHLKLDKKTVTLIITDNSYMRGLNYKYRKKDRATDVISFSYQETPFPGESAEDDRLGDLYISLEKAFSQSEEFGVSMQDEISRLLVHGLLHLLGYDHEKSERQAEKMRKMEEHVLSTLNS